ncbi:MAG: permease [Thermodesulfobacteriota bacterium]|nr:permease [Thermodesulfobacteriota bacterium]
MNRKKLQNIAWEKRIFRLILFPVLMLMVYGLLFAVRPEKAIAAFNSSGKIFLNIMIPFGFVFILLVVFNLFLKPAYIVKFFGKKSGIKGIMLSAAAGIISMGPVYAWYPLLRDLRKKGATNSLTAIFINARAIKPFLLPVMISYFGIGYVIVLTLVTVTGTMVAGYITGVVTRD